MSALQYTMKSDSTFFDFISSEEKRANDCNSQISFLACVFVWAWEEKKIGVALKFAFPCTETAQMWWFDLCKNES